MAVGEAWPPPWRPLSGEIPAEPGVYRFLDDSDRVLYVGKAKSLRSRLSNYFGPLASLADRTRRMLLSANRVEWTTVGSDFEALQLEYTWIKEFDPPFNVQFKDDKSYPYLAITMGDPVPRVMVTRNRQIANARYFGPYSKAWAIRETVDTLLKAFPMRSCSEGVFSRAVRTGRPCLLGDIGKCAAPCVGRVSPEEHKAIALDFAAFMSGADNRFLRDVRRRMNEAAATQEYETAAKLRDQLLAMESALSKNAVVLDEGFDADFIAVVEDELTAAVQQFTVRGGRIRGVRSWMVNTELDVSFRDLVATSLQIVYTAAGSHEPPALVFVPVLPEDSPSVEQWLQELRSDNRRVRLSVARRGDKARLAETVTLNAKQALALYRSRRSSDFTARSAALSELQDALGMAEAPLRIETFDVSHLSGTNIVAAMVVFEDGLPKKQHYRKYSISSARDDTDAIEQVISRRIMRLDDGLDATAPENEGASGASEKRFSYRPQLLLVDGGQPQVNAAARALKGLDTGIAASITVVGIAKRLEELWLPNSQFPVILPRDSEALYLIQRMRDEAHRFAIGYQRQRRKSDLKTVLGDIPGVGPARVRGILKHFGSVAAVRKAPAEDIAKVPGIGIQTARTIFRHLHEPSGTGTLGPP